MRAKLTLLSAFAVGIVGGALASACQTYDFEPVEPLALAQTTVGDVIKAKSSKPNLMVLLDTSGSMKLPVNPSLAACQTSSGFPCGDPRSGADCNVNTCPTRWSSLQGAMSSFLTSNGALARMGLTIFPQPTGSTTTEQCMASTVVKIPIPEVDDADSAGLQKSASDISNVILSIPNSGATSPSGGTPTAASLGFMANQTALQGTDRQDFILLLTDGLPNCNPNNPNDGQTNPAACQCTLSSCAGTVAKLGCLDQDASVASITSMRADDKLKDIKTIVIGFGAETAEGSATATLNAMADAGGFARNRACTTSADCGAGDTCDVTAKRCGRHFYQAANQTELSTALSEIINLVGNKDVCLLELDPAQMPVADPSATTDTRYSLIAVYVNDELKPHDDANTWKLTPVGVTPAGVQFTGALCDQIRASTDKSPVKLEVRAVQRK
ncbi:MAG: adventurous gliding motility lipoprotein CglB [Hyalangium sp.]|uniref:adventurous gliding motility lipoprotein CglB n=1 Tax=Hyalangium sp. TaxID=2028555 RepID=UPI00389A4BA7